MTKIKIAYLGGLKTECVHEASGAKILTIPPLDIEPQGGTLFSPTDLLAAGLGSCMLTLMGMTAKRLAFDLVDAHAEVEKEMVVRGTPPHRRIGRLIVRIRSARLPSEQIRLQLEKAALECPVALSLHPDIKKEIDFIWGAS